MKKSLFIVIEGIDCCGKTTLIQNLKNQLNDLPDIKKYFQKNIFLTFEPGGTDLSFGKEIRELIFNNKNKISTVTEALLFFAARKEHIDKLLIPWIKKQSLIICDRYFLSTVVYQGYFEKIELNWLLQNMLFISNNINPDVTFFLDITKENHDIFYAKKHKKHEINNFDKKYINHEIMTKFYYQGIDFCQQQGQKIIICNKNLSTEGQIKMIISYIHQYISN